jgi:hypothetical protein
MPSLIIIGWSLTDVLFRSDIQDGNHRISKCIFYTRWKHIVKWLSYLNYLNHLTVKCVLLDFIRNLRWLPPFVADARNTCRFNSNGTRIVMWWSFTEFAYFVGIGNLSCWFTILFSKCDLILKPEWHVK